MEVVKISDIFDLIKTKYFHHSSLRIYKRSLHHLCMRVLMLVYIDVRGGTKKCLIGLHFGGGGESQNSHVTTQNDHGRSRIQMKMVSRLNIKKFRSFWGLEWHQMALK